MKYSSALQSLSYLILGIVLPLMIGFWIAITFIQRPAVGIIRLNTDIWAGSAELIVAEIEAARNNENIQAVILQIDSGGGEVVASQTLYLELLNLRREMPVVGSIDGVAASGAYYAAMGTRPLYAKPSSTVGNVGVWSFAPPELGVNDVVLASGPFKLTASNRQEFLRELEGIKQDFIATVFTQREDTLQISRSELSKGLAYSGREAARFGLIDTIGSQNEAIDKAAEMAGLHNYEVIDLQAQVIAELLEENSILAEPWVGAADPVTGERNLPPGIYLLFDRRLRGAP